MYTVSCLLLCCAKACNEFALLRWPARKLNLKSHGSGPGRHPHDQGAGIVLNFYTAAKFSN